MSVIAINPIMPGFYPDPSICAAGEDFYLVNSTFAYFPGLPIMHSRDLAHWEQVGNVMTRESQLPLQKCGHSEGLFAPSIRYYEGMFYVICTNISGGGNFIVTAQEPAGPWSKPYYLEGADGIDPSLFFDDDGTCYYIGTHPNPAGCRYSGDWYIWIQELDIHRMKLVGEKRDVWNGAMRDVIWPEGPHLYKKDGYYYIMNAEGGTGPDHAVTICRSKNIFGPYQNHSRNPILTHRHLGDAYPIKYVGHADLVKTIAEEWYMVMLAVRPIDGYTTMGRETFLAKVIWENGWPVVNPGEGKLTENVEIQLPKWDPLTDSDSYTNKLQGKNVLPGENRIYDFAHMKRDGLGDEFLMLRNPDKDRIRLTQEGMLLRFGCHTLKEEESPSYVAIRQQHHSFQAGTMLRTDHLIGGRKAGIALVQSNQYHLRVEIGEKYVEVILCEKGQDHVIARHPASIAAKQTRLQILVEGLHASVLLQEADPNKDSQEQVPATEADLGCSVLCDTDIRCLSTEIAGGFVGCTVGMFAVDERGMIDGNDDTDFCLFREFHYSSLE